MLHSLILTILIEEKKRFLNPFGISESEGVYRNREKEISEQIKALKRSEDIALVMAST